MTGAPDDDGLALLTMKEAAAELRVDPKTFRRLGVDYIQIPGGVRRYTRAILRAWQGRVTVQCETSQPTAGGQGAGGARPCRGKNFSTGGRVPRIGTSTSPSKVIDFEKVAGLTTKPPRAGSPSSADSNSGTR